MSEQRRKGWSIQVGTVGDIPIRIHVTFLALLVWLLFGTTNASALHETMFVVAVFVCVLLHELGHALTAKRFGVQTNDITLYPFGGVASITSEPGPKAELAIAIAGPIVNIIIAAVISAWITIPDLTKIADSQINIYVRLFYTNIALAVFNLLPALPMDGGRVLRACLVLCKVERSTMIAARISQGLCLVLAVSGLYLQQPMLFIIAILVFLGAMQEHIRVETKAMATAFSIEEAMIPKERLESFPHGTTISRALRTSLTSWQPLYPVLNGDVLLGIVMRDDILEHAVTQPDEYVGEIMKRSIPEIDIKGSLADAWSQMDKSSLAVVAVTRDNHFVGLLAYDRLADFLLLQELKHRMPKEDDIEWTNP